jgi:ubiquinone biosynthesis accessory factor UbiK
MQPNAIDDLTQQILSLLPPGLDRLAGDLRKNMQSIVAARLRQLDLVTREEFEVQQRVLATTRARLEALEQEVARLEAEIKGE